MKITMKKKGAVAALVGIALTLPGMASADRSVDEYQVKAAFLYNFAKFVQWPSGSFDGPSSPIVIGIVGRDPFGQKLDSLVAGKVLDGRRFLIKRFGNAAPSGKVHILFVSSSYQSQYKSLGFLYGQPTLIVGETPEFAESVGGIEFSAQSGRITLEMNLKSIRAAGITISSKLIQVSKVVAG